MKTILTLKYGEKFSSADVNKIVEDSGGHFKYVCATDDTTGLDRRIEVIDLDDEIEGHWEKVKLMQHNLGSVLYLDLDIRIQKSIDHLFDYLNGVPVICYTYWKDKDFPYHTDERWSYNYLSNFNSSVMMCDDASHIYEYWKQDQDFFMVKYAGDDRFLYHENFTFTHFPEGEIYSFVYCGSKYDPDCCIALLNGQEQFPNLVKKYDEICMHQVG